MNDEDTRGQMKPRTRAYRPGDLDHEGVVGGAGQFLARPQGEPGDGGEDHRWHDDAAPDDERQRENQRGGDGQHGIASRMAVADGADDPDRPLQLGVVEAGHHLVQQENAGLAGDSPGQLQEPQLVQVESADMVVPSLLQAHEREGVIGDGDPDHDREAAFGHQVGSDPRRRVGQGDAAFTAAVGEVAPEVQALIDGAEAALERATRNIDRLLTENLDALGSGMRGVTVIPADSFEGHCSKLNLMLDSVCVLGHRFARGGAA